ncbi:unnamed protein product [Sphenostylis stenocarpa]|uniref:Uncharacterized protein n=1 Tax=Sphenostylis stenocarpa TaxID=92480 RepID=A0AA86SBW5_9FABA|nr:unnamed protein product [Sphenostylis stenocarpa]
MKQNSAKASNSRASTTRGKTQSMEHAELSLDAPIGENFVFVILREFLLCLVDRTLSVFYELLWRVISLGFMVCEFLSSSTFPREKEILNGTDEGEETDVYRRKRNISSNGSDKETGQSNKMVRGSKETNNPNQLDNYKGDHCFDISPYNPLETDNFADHGYGMHNCFNNYGDGKQDYNYCSVNSLKSKNSYNNYASGIQAYRGATTDNGCAYESCFNNYGDGFHIAAEEVWINTKVEIMNKRKKKRESIVYEYQGT